MSSILKTLKYRLLLTALSTFFALPAQASFDTNPAWDGTTSLSPFGVSDTATYGQTITVPANASALTSFSFQIGVCTPEDVSLRGSVFAWNGTNATGASLFTSSLQTVAAGPGYTEVTFNTGSLSLPAGEYVLFGSTSDDQGGALVTSCQWGSVDDATYPDGTIVWLNNGADSALWTSTPWSSVGFGDFAIRVEGLSAAPPQAAPTLSEWMLILLALMLGGIGYTAAMKTKEN